MRGVSRVADMAKWLRRLLVAQEIEGSIPFVRPLGREGQ
jgi:hypothetical protein